MTGMDYQKQASFKGDTAKALEFARNYFSALDFRIVPVTQNRLTLENNRFSMDTKQNPVRGISSLTVTVQSGTVLVEADFSKLKSRIKLLAILTGAVDLVMLGLAAAFLWRENPILIALVAVAVAPSPFIFFILNALLMRKITGALDAFLEKLIAAQ